MLTCKHNHCVIISIPTDSTKLYYSPERYKNYKVRFQVLTVASMKTAFWDIVPCSLVEVDQHFRGVYCSIIWAMNKPQARSSLEHRNWLDQVKLGQTNGERSDNEARKRADGLRGACHSQADRDIPNVDGE
jgi:hypothetical protein